ncbi:hypothetical protein CBP51_08400 [Cellvibrio mixtus]|uniref:Uncharacterized protein n=1 Tax=Cellvibrio mixtus TaxID=39650 RepID=A0A266QBI7_9GAMM|nr:hypothetical protein [Cellvibrio mixtus]OZY86996.1 hypothetical protein CBP51_08400 [Cellvibrio mixtus]
MSASVTFNQYWRLMLVMLLPARYVKWLGLLTIVVLFLGAVLYFFNVSFVLYIGSAFSLLLLMMVGMLVPGQMLALRSSKQFQCMADLRRPLFVIALIFWLLVALILTTTMGFLEPKEFAFNPVFALTFMALSSVALLFVVVGSYIQTAQGFVPLFVWLLFFSAKKADLFSTSNTEIYWLVCLLLWLVMVVWWFRWQPQKYLVNFMTLPAAEMQRRQAQNTRSIAAAFSAVPKTLYGSLLLGMSDGIQAWFKRELGHLAFFLIALMFILYLAKQLPTNVASVFFIIYLFIFICIRGGIVFQHFYRNLYRLWMNSNYSRADIFVYMEKQYFLLFAASIIPMQLVFILINHYVLDALVDYFYVAYLLLISILITTFSFYLGVFVYLKSAASFVLLNWISPIVNIVLIGAMVYLNLLWGPSPSHEHANYLWLSSVLLILIVLGRAWVKSLWPEVNFFRVKN